MKWGRQRKGNILYTPWLLQASNRRISFFATIRSSIVFSDSSSQQGFPTEWAATFVPVIPVFRIFIRRTLWCPGCKRWCAYTCPTFCNHVDCSPPHSSVHGILQARVLEWEWVAIPFSRGSSWPRDQTQVSCTVGRLFIVWATREAFFCWYTFKNTACFTNLPVILVKGTC